MDVCPCGNFRIGVDLLRTDMVGSGKIHGVLKCLIISSLNMLSAQGIILIIFFTLYRSI